MNASHRRGCAVALAFALPALGAVGCNALAGIQDGELAVPDSGGTGPGDGTVADGNHGQGDAPGEGSPGADAPAGDGSSGQDVTTGSDAADAGTDAAGPGDATLDADGAAASDGGGADADATTVAETGTQDASDGGVTGPPQFVCSMAPNTLTLVDDLSALPNGSTLSFQHALWIAPGGQNDGVVVVTQRQDDNAFFRAYAVQLDTGVVSAQTYGGLAGTGNVVLLDVMTVPSGGNYDSYALTQYADGTGQNGNLQLVSLPGSPLPPGQGTALGSVGNAYVPVGRVATTAAGNTAWLVATQVGTNYALVAGESAPGGGLVGSVQTLATSTTNNFHFSAGTPFFDLGGSLFTFQGIQNGIGTNVYALPDTLASAGVEQPVGGPDGGAVVLAANPSAASPSMAYVVGATVDPTGQGIQLYGTKVPPSQLTSLTVGPPQFSTGSFVSINDFAIDNTGGAYASDVIASAGSPANGGTGLALALIDSNGNQLTRPGTALIENDGNVIQIGAVAFRNLAFSPVLGGSLYIAWIEHATVDGSAIKYGRIYAAKVNCTPFATGG